MQKIAPTCVILLLALTLSSAGAAEPEIRSTPDGGVRFWEFHSIQENAGSLVLKIKHFNPDLTGWEEKNDTVNFPLVAIEGMTAYFDGLTFARIGKKEFKSAVMIGEQGVVTFAMHMAKPGDGCGAD